MLDLAGYGVDLLVVPLGLLHEVYGDGCVVRLDLLQGDMHPVAVGRVLRTIGKLTTIAKLNIVAHHVSIEGDLAVLDHDVCLLGEPLKGVGE